MDIIDKFYKCVEENNNNQTHESINVGQIIENPTFSNITLIKNITDIPDMSKLEREQFIQAYFYKILHLFSTTTDTNYLSVWLSTEFLTALLAVLNRAIMNSKYNYNYNTPQMILQQENIIQVNNLMYNILTMPEQAKPKKYNEIVNLAYQISGTINSIYVPHLESFGIPRNIAEYIALVRFSSFDLNNVIKRLDFLLINQPKEIMTEENLTNILNYLFPSNNDWISYLQIFMYDVIPQYDTEYWVTQDVEEVDSILNLAVLNALQSRGYQTVYLSVKEYAEYNRFSPKPKRFSLRSISNDYPLILNVVTQLDLENGGYYVP